MCQAVAIALNEAHKWGDNPEEEELVDFENKKGIESYSTEWSAGVKTTSTHPPEGLFTRSAEVIARTLATKTVSPKGPSSGMRMLNFYINRAGKELTEARQTKLEKAKRLLSERIRNEKKGS
jgi:hypothetical protein